MKKAFFVALCLFISACGNETAVTQYNHKTIKLSSTYSDWKKDKDTAIKIADSELVRFTKSACRNQIGRGWSLAEVKNQGEMNCDETSEGFHCRKKNVELVCRQVIEGFPS